MNELDSAQFENLNTPGACNGLGELNFSGADIGWYGHHAYEVTSRTDAKKIYTSLSSFVSKGRLTHFPEGLRFILLSTKKPKLSNAKKISDYKFFQPDTHILSLKDLINKIWLARPKNEEGYRRIRKNLLEQFADILLEIFQQGKDEHLIALVIAKARLIGAIIDDLRSKLGFSKLDTLDFHKMDEILALVNASEPILEFNNWYMYLNSFKEKLLVNIKAIKEHKDLISKSYLLELLLIENQLHQEDIFGGYKKYTTSGLSHASLSFQEIFVHNQLLQKFNQRLDDLHRNSIRNAEDDYRKKNYDNLRDDLT